MDHRKRGAFPSNAFSTERNNQKRVWAGGELRLHGVCGDEAPHGIQRERRDNEDAGPGWSSGV